MLNKEVWRLTPLHTAFAVKVRLILKELIDVWLEQEFYIPRSVNTVFSQVLKQFHCQGGVAEWGGRCSEQTKGKQKGKEWELFQQNSIWRISNESHWAIKQCPEKWLGCMEVHRNKCNSHCLQWNYFENERTIFLFSIFWIFYELVLCFKNAILRKDESAS